MNIVQCICNVISNHFSTAPSRSESEPDIPLVEPELVTMPEAGFPPKPEKKEEETHKVEVEMNVEARKEVSVVEGKFLGNSEFSHTIDFWAFIL